MNETTQYKYIEWRDTQGLHADSINSISELKFLNDELNFLKDLVPEHTLEIIYGRSHEESAKIGEELHLLKSRSKELLGDLITHSNNLQQLTDETDVPNELRDYKKAHYKLMLAAKDFNLDVKKSKRKIFRMMTAIMKKSKQKLL